MSSTTARLAATGAACVFAIALPCSAQQSYPAKPIRLVDVYAPGGPSDVLARTVSARLSERLKQTVIVENRPGAGGTVGTEIAAKAPADGYTLLIIASALSINASLYSKLPYDTLRDFVPITVLVSAPYLLTAHPSLPASSVRDLIALAKARPGELNYGSGGSGTGPHMAMELMKQQASIDITHVPYKGAGPAMIDLVAGQVQVMMVSMIAGMPYVKAGKMKALAVSSATRSTAAPEIPTVAESGLPGFDESGYYGILAPAGTPREIVNRLHAEILAVLNLPDLKARFAAEGAKVIGNTPEQYATLIREDIAKWARVIKASGIRPN
jgi:tripartite-type tricarboxylate transporter receptor subunit TctC